MENKPEALYDQNWFTARTLEHPRVAYYAYPPDASCAALAAFVSDEILVSDELLGHGPAQERLASRCEPLGSVFDEENPPDGRNIQIWRLRGEQEEADVAEFVWSFRKDILADRSFDPSHIAPNHVVIPAPNYHACPWGPPEPPWDDRSTPDMEEPRVRVAIIDSGWVDDGPARDVVTDYVPAAWFGLLPTGGFGWQQPSPSPLLDPVTNRLLALAGHANHVAGVVAQACREAKIVVESLNAAFVEANADPGIPTEAAVARAFWNQRENDLIHIGFAFTTLPNAPGATLVGGPAPWSLQLVLDALQKQERETPFVVSPAGNQNCTVPQYPAAFWPTYDNVVGVGSMRNPRNRSVFSNHGDWVRCCTEGDDVVSTFITYDGETEEPEAGPGDLHPTKRFTGWAAWSGTSFSSPKVTGGLACRKRDGTLQDAWDQLVYDHGQGVGLDMGERLRHLPPAP